MSALYDDDIIDYDVEPEEIHGADNVALERASWHVRHIGELRNAQADVRGVFDAEIARLTDRLQHRLEVLDRQIEWHAKPVRSLHAAILVNDPKRKTIHLPHGTLKARVATKPTVFINDPELVQEWALAHEPDLCPPKQVQVTALRKILVVRDDMRVIEPSTGELVPGVSASVPDPSFSIDTDMGEM